MTFEVQAIIDASDSARVRKAGCRLLGILRTLERESRTAADLGELDTALVLRLDARDLDKRYAAHLRRIAAEL